MALTYREMADDMAAKIAAKAEGWRQGDRLPSTTDLKRTYGVSEATAYRALSLLVDRGLVRGEPGRARFVL